jgi:hypothetical protein
MLQGLCASTRQLRLAPFSVAKEEGKMNKDDDIPGLEAFMRDALEEAHASGLPRPWLLVATCINAYTFVCCYTEPSLGGGLEPEMLGEVISNSGSGVQLPINIMLIGATGDAVRIFVGTDGMLQFIH